MVPMIMQWGYEHLPHPGRPAIWDIENNYWYPVQLEQVHVILPKRIANIDKLQERVLLRQDNTRLYTAQITWEKIQELGGIELLPHPDLVPSDYH